MRRESSPGSAVELDIFRYTACNSARTSRGDGLVFETPLAQWSYALLFDLPKISSGPFVVELTLDSHAGRIGAGCVDDSMSRYVSAEAFFDAAEGTITKTILVDSGTARFLVIRNASGALQSLGTVKRIVVRGARDYSAADLKRMRAARYGYWHYSFDLGDGVTVSETLKGIMGVHTLNQRILLKLLDDNFDVSGQKTCLDAACSSGYHSFAIARRGLSVTAIDIDEPSIDQALFVQSCVDDPSASAVTFRHQDLLEVDGRERYDFVFCSGLFYHLRDLIGGAHKIHQVAAAGAVIHSFVSSAEGDVLELADPAKYVYCFPGEFSFVPTASVLEKIFRYVGFSDVVRYSGTELCAECELVSLEPHYAELFRDRTAYYVLKK